MVALSGITDSEWLPSEMASGLRLINNLQNNHKSLEEEEHKTS
jgi:hypothetical protein